MTQKKAYELIKKFIKHSHECDKSEAIQCALICVDEIIKDRERLSDSLFYNDTYWQGVKKEINFYNANTITDKECKKIIKVIYPR